MAWTVQRYTDAGWVDDCVFRDYPTAVFAAGMIAGRVEGDEEAWKNAVRCGAFVGSYEVWCRQSDLERCDFIPVYKRENAGWFAHVRTDGEVGYVG